MKREYKLTTLATLFVSIFATFPSGVCDAQLQTSATQQEKVYGRWEPPQSEASALDASRKNFNGLFPSASAPRSFKLTDSDQASSSSADPRSSSAYANPGSIAPAPLLENPPARPLQPSGQNRFLQGTFLKPQDSGERVAQTIHNEPSPRESVLPLPNPDRLAQWPSKAPTIDHTTVQDAGTSLTGLIDSAQSSGKDMWGKLQTKGGWGERITSFIGGSGSGRFKNVFGSLAVVVGGYLAFVALMRKFNFTSSRKIPAEVIEVIGSAPFGPRKDLQLVRLGSKLLLLMNSPEGTHPVGEITDPEEVDYLISLCSGRGSKASNSVRSFVKKFGDQNTSKSHNPRRTVHSSVTGDATFSTKQLVQALESLRGNQPRSNAIFEA